MTKSATVNHNYANSRLLKPGFRLGAIAVLAMVSTMSFGTPVAMAQQGNNAAPNFFYSGDRTFPLKPAANWVGVQLQPGTSLSQVAARVRTRNGVAPGQAPLTYKKQGIVLVPVNAQSDANTRQSLSTQLKQEAGVQRAVRVFQNGNYKYPIVETDEFLIQFKAGVSKTQAAALLAPFGAVLGNPLGAYAPNGYVARVTNPNLTSTGVANALYSKPQVLFSHPNYIWPMQPRFVPNDPLYPQQWHLRNTGQGSGTPGADIKAEQAWDVTQGSPSITIAVIDSGIDVDHEDFQGKMVTGFDSVDNDGDPRPNFTFGEEHGTAVAGVAAATGNNGVGVSGVAINCKIMPIRLVVFNQTIQDEADAFRFATDNGADIINNSWGPPDGFGVATPQPDVVRRAITYAVTRGRGGRGCVITWAAGNGGIFDSADQDGYASNPNVISVAASTNQDLHATYSEAGQTVDVAAPSGGGTLAVTTTDIMGASGYDPSNYTNTFSGTSSATPVVSGVAALILSVNPNLTYTQVRDILQNTADKIDPSNGNYDSQGHSNLYGYGRVNALNAVQGAAQPIPGVTLLAPTDNDVIGGNYLLRAKTTNDAVVRRVDFQRKVEGAEGGFTRDPALPIPDSGSVTDSQALTTPGIVDQANISLNITHSFPTSLVVTLIAPDNTRTVVYNRDPRFTVITPQGITISLSTPVSLQGKRINGTWRLEVTDLFFDLFSGTLNSWSMDFSSPWVTIGSASAPVDGEWRAIWSTGSNTSTPPGVYAVRAVAVTNTANGEAVSRNVTVSPLGVTLFAPADNSTVTGNFVLRARTTDDAVVQRVDFQRRRPPFTVSHTANQPLVDGQTTTDAIVVSGHPGRTGEVAVTVNVRHSFIGDLRISLVAPDGSRAVLSDNQGGAQRDLFTTFFNVPLINKPMDGTWRLEIADGQSIDEGTFVSWSLKLSPEWILINRDADGPTSGEFNAEWNADVAEPGIYEVRALAISANGNAFDINTNINVISRAFNISGRVTNLAGAGLNNILVTLTKTSSGAAPVTTRTDSAGNYTMTGVTPGTYTVSPTLPGSSFTPEARTVTVTTGSTSGVNFVQRAPDRIAPTLTLTTPAAAPNNNYRSLTTITGTASDNAGGSGLVNVTGLLFRYANGSTPAGYFNGTTFTPALTAANEVAATGTTDANGIMNFRLTFPSLAPGRYSFRATATDRAGNVKRTSTNVFIIDRTAPAVRVTRPAPAPNNNYTSLTSAAGTASDEINGSGIKRITVLLHRFANGSTPAGFWNGSSWNGTYNTATHERVATGTTNWTIALPTLAPGRYYVRASAEDAVGNITRSAQSIFTIKSATVREVPSSVALSAANATASTGVVQLHFTGVLDAATASDPTHYVVSVNGQRIEVESASYAANTGLVTLTVPEGALARGTAVQVAWSGLTDALGRAVATGGTSTIAR